jgi:hypothetical protein
MKTKKKFVLGPLQEMWLKSLEEHPERQIDGVLGRGSEKQYFACCLGELHICACRINNLPLPFEDGLIVDILDASEEVKEKDNNNKVLTESYIKYGLSSSVGSISGGWRGSDGYTAHQSLASVNDSGVPWKEIAKFIRENPRKVFTKSV